ncbi:MAG TPA: D-alanine--D-alanine ligase family protein [Solirubrobacteraceae bacterium]|jgi:D-alanine-D-alanine ligase
MPKPGLRVGVAFGGRSVEHDVSIITGLQAVEVLSERHLPIPIYLSRSGAWFTGQELRELSSYRREGGPGGEEVTLDIHRGALLRSVGEGSLLRRGRRAEPIELDVVVLATHGTEGEDGCLQGVMELGGLPYVGPPLGAASAAMDKVTTKAVLAAAGLPAADWLALRRERFERDPAEVEASIVQRFQLPVYVKPSCLGSSVGVSRCASPEELRPALELCFELDRVCLVEPAIEGGMEVNCAVLGRPGATPRASVCEQPLAGEQFLSFQDKYMGGGKGGDAKGGSPGAAKGDETGEGAKGAGMQDARRLIPAPIGDAQTRRVQELACSAFEAFGCAGVTRVDFLIDGSGEVLVNECNTIPGSFSFYLWEPAGLPFVDLMDELIDIALAEHAEKQKTTRVFETNLLADRAGGAKV